MFSSHLGGVRSAHEAQTTSVNHVAVARNTTKEEDGEDVIEIYSNALMLVRGAMAAGLGRRWRPEWVNGDQVLVRFLLNVWAMFRLIGAALTHQTMRTPGGRRPPEPKPCGASVSTDNLCGLLVQPVSN